MQPSAVDRGVGGEKSPIATTLIEAIEAVWIFVEITEA